MAQGFTKDVTGATGLLDDLTDVVITTPADNEVLAFDGANWINQTAAEAALAAASHTHDADYISVIAAPAANHFPYQTAGGELVDSAYDAADFATAAHNHDVAYVSVIAAPAANHFPYQTAGGELVDSTYDAADFSAHDHTHDDATTDIHGFMTDDQFDKLAGIENGATVAGSAHTLDDLTTVTLDAPADHEVLAYNAGTSQWLNMTPAEAGLSDTGHSHADHADATADAHGLMTAAMVTKLAGVEAGATVAGAAHALDDLSDVDAAGPTDHDVLQYHTGVGWVHGAPPAGVVASIDDITDVVIDAPADHELLAWNTASSQWLNMTAAEAGLSAAMTAADILAALLTVDSAGCLLDADKLDTLEGAAYTLVDGTRPFTAKQGFAYGTAAAPGLYWGSDVDSGLWGADGALSVATAGTNRFTFATAGHTSTVPILVPVGAAAGPSLGNAADTDTGLFFDTAVVGVATAGVERFRFATTGHTSTVPVLLANGTAAAPTLAASGDTHTGLAFAADDIILSTGGTQRMDVSTTFVTSTLPSKNPDGTAAAPAILPTSDVDTGLFFAAAKVGVTTAGTERLGVATAGITAAVPLLLANGTAAAPTLAASGDTHTGIFYAADNVGISTGGTQRMDVSTTFVTQTIPSKNPDGTAAAPAILPTSDVDTGLFFAAAKVGVSTAGTERLGIATAGITAAVPILYPNGTGAAPSIAATAETDVGLFFASDVVGVATAGVERFRFATAGHTSTVPILHPNGTGAAPAVAASADTHTGMFFDADVVGIATAGTERFRFATAGHTSTVPLLLPYGTAGAPALAWASDTDSGIWGADGHVSISAAGTERVHVDATGLNVVGAITDDGVAVSLAGHSHTLVFPFCTTGTLAVTTDTTALRFRLPFAIVVTGVYATVSTCPTGADIIVDVHKDGTTLFTTQGLRPVIAATAYDSGAVDVPDVTACAADTYLTVNVDQIGSTIAGANLTVGVVGTKVT
jgi:hypothetical protein